jgi:hypothetical protein
MLRKHLLVGKRYYMGVRFCVSILMNVVLALTFVQAPFLHVHEHEETQRHRGGFFHTHFPHPHHLSARKAVEVSDLDPDDDAVFQHWFSATVSDFSTPSFILTYAYAVVPTWRSEPFLEPEILGGHDPPRLTCTSPRSPPV